MGGREAGHGHAERGARDVVEAELGPKVDARRVPAVLAANPDLEIRADFAPALDAHPHQLAHALAVNRLERVVRQDALLDVVEQELGLRVVAAIPHRRLREVVRPEREELRVPGDLVGDEGGPRDLDHGAELVGDRNALPLHDALRLRFERLPLDPQLLREADQRDHDFRPDIDAFPLEATCRLEDRADLHPGDLEKHDAEATAPKYEHRVGLAGELDGFEETLLPRQERLDPSSEIRAAGLPGFSEES